LKLQWGKDFLLLSWRLFASASVLGWSGSKCWVETWLCCFLKDRWLCRNNVGEGYLVDFRGLASGAFSALPCAYPGCNINFWNLNSFTWFSKDKSGWYDRVQLASWYLWRRPQPCSLLWKIWQVDVSWTTLLNSLTSMKELSWWSIWWCSRRK
jgi:hypothetical protein